VCCVGCQGREVYISPYLTLGWGIDVSRLLPFQVLSTRKRKDVQLSEVTVKVILFGFDILYLDGEVPSPHLPPFLLLLPPNVYHNIDACSHCCIILSRREDNCCATTLLKSKVNSHSQKTWMQRPLKKFKPSSKKPSKIPVKVSW